MNLNPIYIPSIDAKDLYLANHYVDTDKNEIGYLLRTRNGDINYNKFINTYDFSLDMIQLRQIARKKIGEKNFSFYHCNKEYSDKVINVTFNYSNKSFNKISTNIYIKAGHDFRDMDFHDCVCMKNGEIIGIKTNTVLQAPVAPSILPSEFKLVHTEDNFCIYELKNNNVLNTVSELRHYLYKYGFNCNGVHYVRFKRSSGSSRVGKCLFIDARLYSDMHKWEMCNIKLNHGDPVDLAALEAYISLPTSSIIDTLELSPESILVIDDYESIFYDNVVETRLNKDNWLETSEENIKISNSIWDGQSLIDISAMGKYSQFGMLLLRNRFFKSCCFNTNIQKFFSDNRITEISQLNGYTEAKEVSEIKLITTPNSIKYTKFGSIKDWINNIDSTFGVVKHEKKTHFFDGRLVQAHYQLLNTVQLGKDDVKELLSPSLAYLNYLNTDIDVLKYHIKCQILSEKSAFSNIMKDKKAIIYKLLMLNDDFQYTKLFYTFKKETCKAYRKNLKKGHVLIEGNYSTLFGNPYEMLLQSIGNFNGTSSIKPSEIYNTRFQNGEKLLGCRSPHVCMGNILLSTNRYISEIDSYFNLTDEIVCINSINENILERLSGADFDSDQMILTNNQTLIQAAEKNYKIFKVPTSNIHAQKVQRFYTAEDQADLDIKTSENKIGEIINLSQELNSLLWEKINDSKKNVEEIYNEIQELYYDICQLDVMSCIEIDKAKKEFSVNNSLELKKIKEKYQLKDNKGKSIKPKFIGFIAQTKGYYNSEKKSYKYYETTMDYLVHIINCSRSTKTPAKDLVPFSSIFRPYQYNRNSINKRQITRIYALCHKAQTSISKLWMTDHDVQTKLELTARLKHKLWLNINNIKINNSTMYALLSSIDKDKHSKISSLLFELLFNYKNFNFSRLIKNISFFQRILVEDTDGHIDLYGIKFSKKTFPIQQNKEE